MAVSVGVLTAKLTMDTAEFSRGATKATTDAKTLGQTISGLNFKQLGAEIAGVGAIMTGVFGGALAFAVKAASDLNESIDKSKVIFGESAKAVQDWAKTAAVGFGQSNQLALESAATFGNLFTSMGLGREASASLSMDMVQLASDMASLNNATPEEMLVKLRAGLVGEIEPLRSVGILMNAATVEAKAMALGLGETKDQISEADKVIARYAIMLEQSTNAQGNFKDTSMAVANQVRIAKAQIEDLTASFGQALLPAVAKGLDLFNKLLGFLARMPDQFKNMALAVAGVTTAAGLAFVAIGTIVAVLGAPLTAAIGGAIAVMAALTAAIALGWERIGKIFSGGVGHIRVSFKQVATILGAGADAFAILARVAISAFDMIVTAARVMVAGVSGAFAALKNALAPVLVGIATNDMGMFVKGMLNLKDITTNTLSNIGGQFKGLSSRIGQDVQDIGNHFTGKFKAQFEKAAESAGSAVRQIGTDLESLKKGLTDAADAATKGGKGHAAAAKKMAESWKQYVGETITALSQLKNQHEAFMADLLEQTQKTNLMWLSQRKASFDQAIVEMQEFGKRQEQWYADQARAIEASADDVSRATDALVRDQKRSLENLRQSYEDAFTGLLGGWATFANKTLEILHGMNSKIPASLGGLLEKITGLFTSSTQQAQKWASAISGIIGGVTTFMGSRHQGLATGIMGGVASGAQMGMAIGSIVPGLGTAVGAGIGAIAGGIAGIFGSGKSAEQKAAEERAKKQMAMDMEKTAIDIQSAAMDVVKKALDAFKALADHVDVPKAAIKSFFKTLEKVTKLFLQLAAKFAKDNLAAAKTFAENLGPVVELMGGAVQAFNALREYTGIPEQAIKAMAADLGKAATAMGEAAIAVEDHLEKKAKRFADRAMPVIDLIAGAFEAFTALTAYQGVAAGVFTAFFADLEIAVNLMGELADNLSRNFLNKAKTYSERIAAVVQAIGTSVAALTSLRTYEAVPQAAFAALEHDIMQALTMIDRLVSAGEMYLDRALTFQSLMQAVAGAISGGVQALRSVSGIAPSSGLSAGAPLSMRAVGGGGPVTNHTTIINGVTIDSRDPEGQRVVESLQALFGQRGIPMTSRAY